MRDGGEVSTRMGLLARWMQGHWKEFATIPIIVGGCNPGPRIG